MTTTATTATTQPSLDALLPPEMAAKAEEVGVAKASMPFLRTATLAVLAGSFIAFGAALATVATTSTGAPLPYGPSRILGGLTFSLGLVLVIVAGAELFTGNNLLVMAWTSRRVSGVRLLRNWTIVYFGNFAGAVAVAWLVYAARLYENGDGAVGKRMLDIATAKSSLGFGQAVALGILANILVCLAVWLCMSARTVTDKVVAIVFPITAFVAMGFEHSVANMYFAPAALLVKWGAPPTFWRSAGVPRAAYGRLTWSRFIFHNLIPVTIGNVIGGAVLVGLVYAFVYLKREPGVTHGAPAREQ
jgi:formate transporter